MLRFYNSLTRKVEQFKPLNPPLVGIYTCGPTVYDFNHIGHARTYIFADLLKRILIFNGYKLKQVMNITDVGHLVSDADIGEDKIELAARREKKTPKEITDFYEKDFWQVIEKFNIKKPDIICHATDYIAEMIALVQALEKKGFTYETSDGIYFDISKFPNYPRLGGFKVEEQKAGARVPVRGEKKNPNDFALWKKADPTHLQQWASPWGKGFPGWHIECSTMSLKHLGEAFENSKFHPERSRRIDIHTGGIDHIQVHHNNEIVQSEAATGKPFVNYWLHGQHLLVDGKKMAKSLRNFYRLVDLENRGFEPLDFRYLCLTVHYRARLNFTWDSLEAARSAFSNLRQEISSWDPPRVARLPASERSDGGQGCAEFEEKFLEAINNDLNLPEAVAVLWQLVKSDYPSSAKAKSLLKFDQVLGLKFDEYLGKPLEIPKEVKKLVDEREEARKMGDFKKADKLRSEIEKIGFEIEDTFRGPKLKVAPTR